MSGAGRIAGLPSSLRVHSLRLVPGEEIKSSLVRSVLKSLFCTWIFGVGTFGQFTFGQLLRLVNCYKTSADTFHPTTSGQLIQTHIKELSFCHKLRFSNPGVLEPDVVDF